jgi:hypothetical protein
MSSTWNRSTRRSGGYRSAVIHVPVLDPADAQLILMVEKVRREFGESGVTSFFANMRKLNPKVRDADWQEFVKTFKPAPPPTGADGEGEGRR